MRAPKILTVDVEVNLADFDSIDLADELERRGYTVDGHEVPPPVNDAAWRWSRGEYDEALEILARWNPAFRSKRP